MLYELLTTLEQTPALKQKEALVASYRDNEEVKRMFRLALDPRVLFNTTRFPDHGSEPMKVGTWKDVLDKIEGIANEQPRGNALASALEELVSGLTSEQYLVAKRIVLKDLRCNTGETITNKVWKGLIPEWPYMGAKSDNPKNRLGLKIEKGALVQDKCDGMFCNVVCVEGYHPSFITRQGNVITLIDGSPIVDEAFHLPKGVWHGELRVLDIKANQWLPRHIGNGIIKQGLDGGTIELPPDTEIIFTAWDYCPYDEWCAGEWKKPYSSRFNFVNATLAGLEYSSYRVVRSRSVNNWMEANAFYQMVLEEGGEGAIVKRLDGKWKDGKPSWQVKMKVEETCDMLVVGVVPHTKKEGLIGALIVTSDPMPDGGGLVLEAQCGGLMEEAMQKGEEFWLHRVIRMKYNALSPYGRFDHPRVDNGHPNPKPFACVREPGSKPNTAQEIKDNYAAATGGTNKE